MELSRIKMQRSVFLLKITQSQCATSFGENKEKPVADRQTHVTLRDFEQQITAGGGMNKSDMHPAKLSLVADAVSPATFPVLSPKFQLSLVPGGL